MKLKAWASVMALVVLPHVASGDIDSTVLMKHKDWEVTHDYLSSTDSSACSADTTNGSGDLFSLITWERGGASLMIMMASDFEGWDGTFSADAILHIDYEQWTLNDASFGVHRTGQRTIWFDFPDNTDKVGDFLEDLWRGSKVALKTPKEKTSISVWSLKGSAAALGKLSECTTRIRGNSSTTRY